MQCFSATLAPFLHLPARVPQVEQRQFWRWIMLDLSDCMTSESERTNARRDANCVGDNSPAMKLCNPLRFETARVLTERERL